MAPLQPLQQTVFEQGPQAATVPADMPPLMYQEGQVILPDPINPAAALDPGINWYGLGEQTMKIAQEMVTETWDYLIQTKENGLTDLSDKYQSQLDNAYMRLSSLQSEAQKRGGPTAGHNDLIDGLVKQISEVQEQWKTEANKVLGVGEKPTIFDPKLDAFNAKLPGLGLKYQRLALTARGADRDINNAAEKLLFQAQLARLTSAKQNYDVEKAKDGNGEFPDGADRVQSGLVALNQTADTLRSAEMFFDKNGVIKTDNGGMPLVNVDEAGNVTINPDANRDVWTPKEFDYVIGYSQSLPYSAVMDNGGRLNKEETQRVMRWLSTAEEDRNANTGFQIGRLFSLSAPSAIATFAKDNKLSAAQTATLGAVATMVATGRATPQTLAQPLRWLKANLLEQSSTLIRTLATPQIGSGMARSIPAAEKGTIESIVNNVLLPTYAAALGLSPEDAAAFMKQYQVASTTARGFTTITDANSDEFMFTQLMADNPHLDYLGMAAVAFYEGNKELFGTFKDGTFTLDTTMAEQAMKQFSSVLTSNTGMISFKNDSGRPVSVWNPNLRELTPVMTEYGTQRTTQAYLSSDLSRRSANDALVTVKQVFSGTDENVFLALTQSMAVVQENENGERIAKNLPMSEHLRLGLASDPNFWIAMGWADSTGRTITSVEQANALSFDEKINLAKISAEQLAPAHEWDVDMTVNPNDYAFAQSEQGGIPIRFINIKDSSGKVMVNRQTNRPIFDVLVPKQSIINNTYTPRDGQGAPVIAVPTRLTSIQPGRSVTGILSDAAKLVNENQSPYTLAWGENRPASGPMPMSFALEKAVVPDPNTELGQRLNENFPTSPSSPLVETSDDLMRLMNRHGAAVSSLVELDPVLQGVVQYFDNDFAIAGKGEPVFFTEEVLNQIIEKGKKLGLTTNGEYVGLMLSTIAFKQENLHPTEDWGLRNDGVTPKGPGWLGVFYTKDGQPVTEYSIGVEINGKKMDIPTLVPSLTAAEIESVVKAAETNSPVSEAVVQKAVAFARNQINKGDPIFKEGLTEAQRKSLAALANSLQVRSNKKNQKATLKKWELRREKLNKELEAQKLKEWKKRPWQQRTKENIVGMKDVYPISAAAWWLEGGVDTARDFKKYADQTMANMRERAREYDRMKEAAYKERGLPVPGPYDRSAYGAGLAVREFMEGVGEEAAINLSNATPEATASFLEGTDQTRSGARAGAALRSMAYDYLYGPNNTVQYRQEEAQQMLKDLDSIEKRRRSARAGAAFRSLLHGTVYSQEINTGTSTP
jgi:hypothetical protein